MSIKVKPRANEPNPYTDMLRDSRQGTIDANEAYGRIVYNSIKEQDLLTEHLHQDDEVPQNFGERLADKVAVFGGSWTFIMFFGGILVVWMLVNTVWLRSQAFDPYPFILLNLVLSTIAALQAPVIMMSQNRKEIRDRHRAEDDYMINLKSEIEIRSLNEKLDVLITTQMAQLLEQHKSLCITVEKLSKQA